LTVVVVALAVWLGVQYAFTPEFPVHKEGVIVITGASTGIGKHAALELDRMGYVVFAGVRKVSDFAALSKEFSSKSRPILLDVTSLDDIARAFHEVSAYLQSSKLPLVGLVNNAGIAYSMPVEFNDPQKIRDLFTVNVLGLYDITREFLPLLRKYHGRVVNIGSVSGLIAKPFSSGYSGTKFAVEAFTDALRREMIPHKVAVSVVEPAFVITPIAEKSTDFDQIPEEQKSLYDFDGVVAKREKSFEHASSPDVTTEAIVHALTHPSPRTRYVVANVFGIPAWIITRLMWLLPDHIADLLVT